MSTERPVRLRVRSSNAADPSARARAEHAAAAAAAANADAGGAARYQSRSSPDVSLEESGDRSILANVFVASAAGLPEVRSPRQGLLWCEVRTAAARGERDRLNLKHVCLFMAACPGHACFGMGGLSGFLVLGGAALAKPSRYGPQSSIACFACQASSCQDAPGWIP